MYCSAKQGWKGGRLRFSVSRALGSWTVVLEVFGFQDFKRFDVSVRDEIGRTTGKNVSENEYNADTTEGE